jgi:hypothetical protein
LGLSQAFLFCHLARPCKIYVNKANFLAFRTNNRSKTIVGVLWTPTYTALYSFVTVHPFSISVALLFSNADGTTP